MPSSSFKAAASFLVLPGSMARVSVDLKPQETRISVKRIFTKGATMTVPSRKVCPQGAGHSKLVYLHGGRGEITSNSKRWWGGACFLDGCPMARPVDPDGDDPSCQISIKDLCGMIKSRDVKGGNADDSEEDGLGGRAILELEGGVAGLAQKIGSSLSNGVRSSHAEALRSKYGANYVPPPKPKTYL
ncbi:hypothetical protein FOZ63_011432, partial [Perkinsus olseni]